MIRFPKICTRCGSLSHYAEDCKIPTMGMCDAERDMVDAVRRDRNCVIAIIVVLMVCYFSLILIGVSHGE